MDRPLLVRCASCGRNFETERYGRQPCPICHAEIDLDAPEGEATPEPEPAPAPAPEHEHEHATAIPATEPSVPHAQLEISPAWEVPGPNLVSRFFQTLRQVLSAPSLLFYGLKIDKFGRALSFGWILCTLAIFFSMLYSLWSLDRDPQAILRSLQLPPGTNPQEVLETLRSRLLVGLYASPLLGLLNPFLSALLYHLGILMLSKKNRGFLATFRATAYACAPLILSVIPFIGLFIGSLGTIVLQILALSAVHRLALLRAIVAVILPTVAVLLLIMGFF